jgi:hypothetical protein
MGRMLILGLGYFARSVQEAIVQKHSLLIGASIAVLCLSVRPGMAQSNHPRGASAPTAATVTQSGACAAGADTRTGTFLVGDDNTADNVPAAGVGLTKTCNGITIGTFSAETNTTNGPIHMNMTATCASAGGQSSPCTPGTVVQANPGHTFFRNVLGGTQVHTMTMVWPNLLKGRWLFHVRLGDGGDPGGSVDFRTFTVVTY